MRVILSAGLGLIVGLIVGALWIGPDRVGHLAESDVVALNDAVGEVNQAFLGLDWATVVSYYQEDVVLMPPNGPAFSGRAKLRSLLEAIRSISWLDTAIDEIDGCRDVAFIRSYYSLTVEPEGLPPIVRWESGCRSGVDNRTTPGA